MGCLQRTPPRFSPRGVRDKGSSPDAPIVQHGGSSLIPGKISPRGLVEITMRATFNAPRTLGVGTALHGQSTKHSGNSAIANYQLSVVDELIGLVGRGRSL